MRNDFDVFETRLNRALEGKEEPAPDFAARVMAQVCQTPQEKSGKTAMGKKWWPLAAACAALVVIAIPFFRIATMKAGAAAPMMAADCATEECAPAENCMEGMAVVEESDICEEPASQRNDVAAAYSYSKGKEAQEDDGWETVVVSPDLAVQVRAWLEENGYVDDGGYLLSARETEDLNEAVPELHLPDCTVQLILADGE